MEADPTSQSRLWRAREDNRVVLDLQRSVGSRNNLHRHPLWTHYITCHGCPQEFSSRNEYRAHYMYFETEEEDKERNRGAPCTCRLGARAEEEVNCAEFSQYRSDFLLRPVVLESNESGGLPPEKGRQQSPLALPHESERGLLRRLTWS